MNSPRSCRRLRRGTDGPGSRSSHVGGGPRRDLVLDRVDHAVQLAPVARRARARTRRAPPSDRGELVVAEVVERSRACRRRSSRPCGPQSMSTTGSSAVGDARVRRRRAAVLVAEDAREVGDRGPAPIRPSRRRACSAVRISKRPCASRRVYDTACSTLAALGAHHPQRRRGRGRRDRPRTQERPGAGCVALHSPLSGWSADPAHTSRISGYRGPSRDRPRSPEAGRRPRRRRKGPSRRPPRARRR